MEIFIIEKYITYLINVSHLPKTLYLIFLNFRTAIFI